MNKVNKNHINELKGALKDIFEAELAAGNTVQETSKGGFSNSDNIVIVALSKPFLTPVKKDIEGIYFQDINDPHYWKAEYYDPQNNVALICGFSSPDDLRHEF